MVYLNKDMLMRADTRTAVWLALMTLTVTGCSKPQREVKPTDAEVVEAASPSMVGQPMAIVEDASVFDQPPMTVQGDPGDEQVMLLFAGNWKIDEPATLEYVDNATIDKNSFQTWILQQGLDWSMTAKFSNDGLQCTTGKKTVLLEVPIGEPTFSQRIRMIGTDRFAVLEDGHWLVFVSQ